MSDQLPPVDHSQAEPKSKWEVSSLVGLIIIGAATAILFAIFFGGGFSHRNRAREKANQIQCASNLREIGQAVMAYSLASQGAYPPDLQTLAAKQSLGLDVFVCRSTPDNKPATIAAIGTPGCCSYIYVGAGLTTRANPECIVAFDDPDNHHLEGSNVLFADGHVEFIDLPLVQQMLNDLNAGRNPPATLTPSLSIAGAEQDYQKNWKSRMPQLKAGAWRIPSTLPANAPK